MALSAVLSPDGAHLLVSNSGAGIRSLQVVDAASGGVVQTIPYTAPANVFVGLAYRPDGTRAYASGGERQSACDCGRIGRMPDQTLRQDLKTS